MFKACSKCGKIHDYTYKCSKGSYRRFSDRQDVEASKLRSKSSWQRKREDIRARAFNLCEYCKAQGVYTYDNLEIHHITKLADNLDGLLVDSNLICLCQKHHRQADNGEISKDELIKLVATRDSAI